MNKNEYIEFRKLWVFAHDASVSNKELTNESLMHIFDLLEDFHLKHIEKALNLHSKKSKFSPTPHDVINILQSHGIYSDPGLAICPSPDEIVALAKMADTPLGVLAAIQIGSYDLNNQDSFYLRQRAQEVILKFDDYVNKCFSGSYTDHEISTMKKYEVDCLAPMARGLPRPAGDMAKQLQIRANSIPNREEPKLRLVSKNKDSS